MGNFGTRWNQLTNRARTNEAASTPKSDNTPPPRCSGHWYTRPDQFIVVPTPCVTCSRRIKGLYATKAQKLADKREDFRKLREDYPQREAEQSQEDYNAFLDKRFVEYSYLAKRHLNKRKIEITYSCPNRRSARMAASDSNDSSDDPLTETCAAHQDTPL